MRLRARLPLLIAAILAGAPDSAHAVTIDSITTTGAAGDLQSVTVQRGAGLVTYSGGDLIGITVDAFDGLNFHVAFGEVGAGTPAPGTRAALLDGDLALATGLVNVDNTTGALGVTFDQPVVNSLGPDLVLFDIGNGEGIVVTVGGADVTYATRSGRRDSRQSTRRCFGRPAGDRSTRSPRSRVPRFSSTAPRRPGSRGWVSICRTSESRPVRPCRRCRSAQRPGTSTRR